MAYAITVRAEVVDIRKPCTPPDHLFVDTNVWRWLHYSRVPLNKQPQPYQTISYPKFLKKVLDSGGQLYHSGLQLAEFMHLIEDVERKIYEEATGDAPTPKEFRHNYPLERQVVVREVMGTWDKIEKESAAVECTINPALTSAALTRFFTEPLDGYDLYFIESLLQTGITRNILTDDGDFATGSGIRVYTANKAVIEQAGAVDKLTVP